MILSFFYIPFEPRDLYFWFRNLFSSIGVMYNYIDQVTDHRQTENGNYPEYSSAAVERRRFNNLPECKQIEDKAKHYSCYYKNDMKWSPGT